MRKALIALATAGGIGIFGPSIGMALPINGGTVLDAIKADSPVQDARLFCYNRFTGRFIHWGSCAPRRIVRRVVRPRVYCYNRFTGRFLHWGSC